MATQSEQTKFVRCNPIPFVEWISAKDVWGLATEIRKEAERLESTMCDVNGDTNGMKDLLSECNKQFFTSNSLLVAF